MFSCISMETKKMNNEIELIEKESNALVVQANNFEIKTQEHYANCANFKKICAAMRKKILETFDPIVKKSKNAYDEARGQRDKHLEPVISAENIAKNKVKQYENEQFKIQQEAERKARMIAEEKARKERERIERQAEKAIEKGQDEKAETLIEKAEEVMPEPVTVMPTIDRVKGMGIRRLWKFRIVDATKIPREYFKIDEMKIGQVVRALKENTNIAGIQVYQE